MTDQEPLTIGGNEEIELERELHRQSFADFVRDSWHTLHSPEQPYVHNWHVDAIAEHLMAVYRGEITRLLINIPYGMPIAEDEPVITDRGLLPLREVRVGDRVFTHRGRFRRVSAVHEQGELDVVQVNTRLDRSVVASPQHPFLTMMRGWIDAGWLQKGETLGVPAYVGEHVENDAYGHPYDERILDPDYVDSVNYYGKALCRCLTVDEDHSFTVDGLAVHNSKSLLSTVMFPSWEWGPGQRPHLSYMCASYEMERLGKRDLGRMRSLVGSEWYQERYGDQVRVDSKNDTKEKFHNLAGGFRETRPIGGMTGGRADRVIIDDPHSTEGAESEAERERTLRIFSESIPSRLNKPRESAIIVIMQRLHERDVSGHILEQELGYNHLVLPMRFERDHPYPNNTVLGFTDPRSEEGELLFPERFPESVVASDEQAFGGPHSYAAAGQLQQRPEPRGGGLIRVDKLEHHQTAPNPATIRSLVRYWDKACFVPGTPITVRGGNKPIEQVEPGDEVLTRYGWRRVTNAWLSKYTESLTTLVLSDGRCVTGTPDHPVYTKERGWVEMASLTAMDTLVIDSGCSPWQSQDEPISRSSSSTAGATFATRLKKLKVCLGRATSSVMRGIPLRENIATDSCTGMSGSTTMAQYPRAIISTTLTATGPTTTSTILSVYQRGNTGVDTRMICRTKLQRLIRRIEQRQCRHFGIESPSGKPTDAKCVEATSKQRALRPSSASPVFGSGESIEIGSETGGVPVYDLGVEGVHEFFANGILVHNSTASGGAYTAGVLMARLVDGFTPAYVILDVVRGQWSSGQRDRMIRQTADLDQERWGRVQIYLEQEPGSGGKDSYQATAQQLAGFEVWPDRVTGDKTSRAAGFASQVEANNVAVLDRAWTRHLVNELEKFPNGRYRDQGDATAGAFAKLNTAGFAGAWGSRRNK